MNLGLVLFGIAISALLTAVAVRGRSGRVTLGIGYALLAAVLIWSSPVLYAGMYERLLYQDDYYDGRRFAHVVENRSGIVTLSESGTVYGGGSYDGQMNIDPRPGEDTNRVLRAYLIPAFHSAPRNILMIGVGSGSWLEVLSNFDEVDRITVVEINAGYLEIMRRTPLVAPALVHPKVKVIVDDGRRFLSRTTESFDIIISNTTVYWRAHAANLLSREYFELAGRRLNPGGIVYANSTQSVAVHKTMATVFPHAWRYQNMVLAGFDPIRLDFDRWRVELAEWTIRGAPVFDPVADDGLIDQLSVERMWRGGPTWESRTQILSRTRREPIITDDNMATEWWAWETFPSGDE